LCEGVRKGEHKEGSRLMEKDTRDDHRARVVCVKGDTSEDHCVREGAREVARAWCVKEDAREDHRTIACAK
jgi:hypothetical protein